MDRRERINDPYEAQLLALIGMQAGMWTALPAFVVSYDPAAGTISAQPTIQVKRTLPDGSSEWVQLPVLGDVPVVFPSGGGFSLTFPIKPDDECLVVFSSRCIDGWWQLSGIQPQLEMRMHNLSDGFAFVGPRSKPKVVAPAPNGNNVQLRADDGTAFVEITSDHKINIISDQVNIQTTGPTTITAAGALDIIADLNVTGNTIFTGTVHANGKRIDELHTHAGVTPGGGTSGTVNSP